MPATRNYTTNGLNQYTQVVSGGTIPFTYDANGNLTSSSDTSGAWTYLYDVENRMVRSTFTPTPTGPVKVTDLRYDPMGRLYELKHTIQTATPTITTTRFLHDGDELIAEYDCPQPCSSSAADVMLKRYVHGIAVDDPVVEYVGSSLTSPRHLLADRQGSIIGLTDNTGAIIAKNTYDEYGIPKSDQVGQAVIGRFAYTGQIWLPELGMYHYKARLYSPTLGRFLQTDPIGYDDQINLYGYVGNDPINKSDPTGKTCQSVDAKKKTYSCKVDNRDELMKTRAGANAVRKIERAYTAAVNRLMQNPDKMRTISASDGKSTVTRQMSQGALGDALVARVMNYGGAAPPDNRELTSPPDSKGKITTTLFDRSVLPRSTSQVANTIIHSGAHGTLENSSLRTEWNSQRRLQTWDDAHQNSYKALGPAIMDDQ